MIRVWNTGLWYGMVAPVRGIYYSVGVHPYVFRFVFSTAPVRGAEFNPTHNVHPNLRDIMHIFF